jgi:small nuclear ribonucleoprotein (snRNP)-like protein
MPDASTILLREKLNKSITISCDGNVSHTGTLLSFDRFSLVMQHDDGKKRIHIRGKIHNIEV